MNILTFRALLFGILLLGFTRIAKAQIYEQWTRPIEFGDVWEVIEGESGNVFVLSKGEFDFQVRKFSPEGDLLYSRGLEPPIDSLDLQQWLLYNYLAVNDNDEAVFVLPVRAPAPANNPYLHLVKLDPNGDILREDSLVFPSVYFSIVTGLFFQPNGNLFIGGAESGSFSDVNAILLDTNFNLVASNSWVASDPVLLDFQPDRYNGVWIYFYDNGFANSFFHLIHLNDQLGQTNPGTTDFVLGVKHDYRMYVDQDGNVWKCGFAQNRVYVWKHTWDGTKEVDVFVSNRGVQSTVWSMAPTPDRGVYVAGGDGENFLVLRLDSLGNMVDHQTYFVEDGDIWKRPNLRSGPDGSLYATFITRKFWSGAMEDQIIIKFDQDLSISGNLVYPVAPSATKSPFFNFYGVESDSTLYVARNWHGPDGNSPDSSEVIKVCFESGCDVPPVDPVPPVVDFEEIPLQIWPNPAQGSVFMTIPPHFHPRMVRIWDQHGKLVQEEQLDPLAINYEVNLENLRPAVYIYELYYRHGVLRHRLVVTR